MIAVEVVREARAADGGGDGGRVGGEEEEEQTPPSAWGANAGRINAPHPCAGAGTGARQAEIFLLFGGL